MKLRVTRISPVVIKGKHGFLRGAALINFGQSEPWVEGDMTIDLTEEELKMLEPLYLSILTRAEDQLKNNITIERE